MCFKTESSRCKDFQMECYNRESNASEMESNVCMDEHIIKPHTDQISLAQGSYRLERLKTENEKMRSSLICRLCNSTRVQTLTLPCCHIVCCESCADLADDCPLCSARILGTVRIYVG